MSFTGPDVDPPGAAECPNCGAELPGSAAHCDQCGNSILGTPDPGARQPSEGLYCPFCATPNRSGALYCASCGNRLWGGAPAGEAAAVFDPHPTTQTAVSSSGREWLAPVTRTEDNGLHYSRGAFRDEMRSLRDGARPPVPAPTLFGRIGDAETAVERAQAEFDDALHAVQLAAGECIPGSIPGVDQDGHRSAWLDSGTLTRSEQLAAHRWAEASQRADLAAQAVSYVQQRLNRLLAEYEAINQPL